MTAQIAAYGRLVDDPQVKQTSKGTPMTLARMAVSLPCSQAQDGQATLWLSVLHLVSRPTRWRDMKKATLSAWRVTCRSVSGPDRTEKYGRAGRLSLTA